MSWDGGEIETQNAKIIGTHLGTEDHGIFTCYLNLDYGGSCQSAGGYGLDTYFKRAERRLGTAAGLDLLMRILNTLGAEKWEALTGMHIRVKKNEHGIYEIGGCSSATKLASTTIRMTGARARR